MSLGPVTRSSKMAFRRDGIVTWWVQRDRKATVNFRNEIEILGGLLKVAQRNSWGWEGWTAGEVVWISGRILESGRTEEELQDGWG